MGAGWVVGVCINLVGSIMINLGTNVMKMGHNKLAAIPGSSARPKPAIYKLREWQIGVSLFSIGNVANFVSFGYAAQSLLAAIGCIQFVSNVVFASWVLKEQVSRGVLVATAAIVAGCVLLVSGGSHVSVTYTYKELLHLYGRPAYVSYLSVGGAAVLLTYGAYWMGSKAVIAKGPEATPIWTAALPILYSIFSALIGTQSVLFSKTLAVLLRSTAQGDNQLTKWFTWFVLVAFLTSAVFWVTRLNKGLRMFPALIIVPSLQICWTLFSILSGMLYFHEYEGMRAGPTAIFVIGVAVVFVGVFLLTRASQPGAAAAGHAAELQPLGSKARIAYVVDEAEHPLAPGAGEAPSDSRRWQLSAVRSAQSVPSPQELSGMLRGVAQLHQGSEQLQEPDEDEASDEEEYERALLACTSGRCGGGNGSHLGMLQQQGMHQQQCQWSLPAQDICAAAARSMGGDGPADPQPADRAASGGGLPAALRIKERWLRKASSLKRRVALDFSLDETAAAKLTLGLGDSHTPGFSLFTMPMVDIREMPHQVNVHHHHAAVSQKSSTWRSAEVIDGQSYGRAPEMSVGGAPVARGLGPLTVPTELDDTGCISQTGGPLSTNILSGGSAIANNDRSSFFSSSSSMWTRPKSLVDPPGGRPSEPEAPAPGPFKSINPLANAIDLRSTRTISQESVPSAAAAGSKWKVIQQAIKLNVQELKAKVQQGPDGGSAGKAYTSMSVVGQSGPVEAVRRFSDAE